MPVSTLKAGMVKDGQGKAGMDWGESFSFGVFDEEGY
jgi:hypothetical protein